MSLPQIILIAPQTLHVNHSFLLIKIVQNRYKNQNAFKKDSDQEETVPSLDANSRVRNKHSPTLINLLTFFQGLRSYSGLDP